MRPFRFECAGSWTRMYVYFSGIKPIIEDPQKRQELFDQLSKLGASLSDDSQYPSIDCTVLQDTKKWDNCWDMLKWILDESF